MEPPRALLFDVFGTCVDWRSSIIREGQALVLHREALDRVLADAGLQSVPEQRPSAWSRLR